MLVVCDCVLDQVGIRRATDIQARRDCPDCHGRGFVEDDCTEAALEAAFEAAVENGEV